MGKIRSKSLILLAAATAAITPFVAQGAVSGRTIDDRVFGAEQAARGENAYQDYCAACHGADMAGNDRAPGLASDAFMYRWNGQTLDDVYQRVSSTMPQGAPHSLPPQTYVDIVSYILLANGVAAGKAELKPDPDALKTIRFVTPD